MGAVPAVAPGDTLSQDCRWSPPDAPMIQQKGVFIMSRHRLTFMILVLMGVFGWLGTALADAAATALCNQVQTPKDIETAIAAGKCMTGVQGIVIISGKQIGLWGDLELVKL